MPGSSRFLVLIGCLSTLSLQFGCASVMGEGNYMNFVDHDCAATFRDRAVSDDEYQTCIRYAQDSVKSPEAYLKMTKQYLSAIPENAEENSTIKNIRVIVGVSENLLTQNMAEDITRKLGMSPFEKPQAKFSTTFWKSAKADKWDLSWLSRISLQNEVVGHCDDFKELVLKKLSEDQLLRWALDYSQKWSQSTSACYTDLSRIIHPYILKEQKRKIEVALKSRDYSPVISGVTGYPGYQNDASLLGSLGTAYLASGNGDGAVEALTSAVQLDPKNGNYKSALKLAKDSKKTKDVEKKKLRDNFWKKILGEWNRTDVGNPDGKSWFSQKRFCVYYPPTGGDYVDSSKDIFNPDTIHTPKHAADTICKHYEVISADPENRTMTFTYNDAGEITATVTFSNDFNSMTEVAFGMIKMGPWEFQKVSNRQSP